MLLPPYQASFHLSDSGSEEHNFRKTENGLHCSIFYRHTVWTCSCILHGNPVGNFHTQTVHIGVNARISAAAPFNVGGFAYNPFKRLLKHLLNGHCVLLNLPAVEPAPVVANGKQKISHMRFVRNILHSITAAISIITAAIHIKSWAHSVSFFILVLPSPP